MSHLSKSFCPECVIEWLFTLARLCTWKIVGYHRLNLRISCKKWAKDDAHFGLTENLFFQNFKRPQNWWHCCLFLRFFLQQSVPVSLLWENLYPDSQENWQKSLSNASQPSIYAKTSKNQKLPPMYWSGVPIPASLDSISSPLPHEIVFKCPETQPKPLEP